MNKAFGLFTLVVVVAYLTPNRSMADETYSSEEVYSVLYDALRRPLEIPSYDPKFPYWLSMSLVGSVINPDDLVAINDLANFCPPASPVIAVFSQEPKLDTRYERIIAGMVGPRRDPSPAYLSALAVLRKDNAPTPEYVKYREFDTKYAEAFSRMAKATEPSARAEVIKELQNIQKDWGIFGNQKLVNEALNTIFAEEFRGGAVRTARRREVLESYRKAASLPGDPPSGGFRSPVSTFSPAPDRWADDDGWLSVSYSSQDTKRAYKKETAKGEGFAGLTIGYVTVAAVGGGGTTNERRVKTLSGFKYEFQIKRANISRPWLDTEVFFDPANWTWRRQVASAGFPRVAVPREPFGLPVDSNGVYQNSQISVSLLPVAAVIARQIRIEATVTKEDYKHFEEANKVGLGVAVLAFVGGGQGNWTTTKTHEDESSVTFVVESKGVSVIGLISQVVPVCPQPSRREQWPEDAMLP